MFPVVTVNSHQAESLEQLGTKRKYWYAEGVRRLLFKAEERGTGEDWAEKLSCELAGLMGLPHVIYELAEEVGSGTPGVVCETCSPPPWSLVLGNQLLLARETTSKSTRFGSTRSRRWRTYSVICNCLPRSG